MIDFKNVCKNYGGRIDALKNINLHIGRGEFVSVVGSSGAGKSTLVRLLICEEKPTVGTILIANYDITQLSSEEIPFFRRKIGVVFQDYKLLPQKNVFENVAYALEVCGATDAEIRTEVPKVLDLVGLKSRALSMPSELSGGERQRLSIARALVHKPKLLIADEPTGNLDPKNSFDIIKLLLKINAAGTIVILTTHDKAVVDALKRRVITIQDGKIVRDIKVGKYEN